MSDSTLSRVHLLCCDTSMCIGILSIIGVSVVMCGECSQEGKQIWGGLGLFTGPGQEQGEGPGAR